MPSCGGLFTEQYYKVSKCMWLYVCAQIIYGVHVQHYHINHKIIHN